MVYSSILRMSEIVNPFAPSSRLSSSRPKGVLLGEEGKSLWRRIDGKSHVRQAALDDDQQDELIIEPSQDMRALKETRALRPREFRLKSFPGKRIPFFDKTTNVIDPRGLALESMRMSDMAGHKYDDFALSNKALDKMGITDKHLRAMLLTINQNCTGERIGRIVFADYFINLAQQQGSGLKKASSKEIVEKMYELGYRPACLKELLGYIQLWREIEGRGDDFEDALDLQRCYLSIIGSAFVQDGEETAFTFGPKGVRGPWIGCDLMDKWDALCCLLFIRDVHPQAV